MSNSDKVQKKHSFEEKEVLEYLKLNPEIFEKHETFLTKLNLHYDNQGVSSLVKKQLASLRKKNFEQRTKYNELLHNAETNWKVITKIKNIIESCNKYKSLDRWIAHLSKNMSTDFDADEAFIQVKIMANKKFISSMVPKNCKIDELSFKDSFVYSGSLDDFNQKKAIVNSSIKSIVFCPLHTKEWSGFLYLGSLNPDRYSASYEPDLLNLLASVLKLSISMQLKGIV